MAISLPSDAGPVARSRARSSARTRWAWLLALGDLTVILGSFWAARLAHWQYHGYPFEHAMSEWSLETATHRAIVYTLIAVVAVFVFRHMGHYTRRRSAWQELGDIWGAVVIFALLDAAAAFYGKQTLSRLWVASNWILVAATLPLMRYCIKHALMRLGTWSDPTVIVGTGPNAVDTALAFLRDPLLGQEIVGFLSLEGDDKAPHALDVEGRRFPVFRADPQAATLPPVAQRSNIVVALELTDYATNSRWVERLGRTTADVDLVSPLRGLPVATTEITHFISHDVLTLRLRNNLARRRARFLKRSFDLVAATALVVLTAPLFAFVCVGLQGSGGSPIFGHRRVGRDGEEFTCLKFRTMVPDAEYRLRRLLEHDPSAAEEWAEYRKLRNDPRVTPIGRWLRRTSLDELPQLINVLRGEMSLVGPRPVIEDELKEYGENVTYYLEARPGLTGLWQVSGRNDVDYRRRVHLDTWYVRNWQLWYDIVILFKTIPVLFGRAGAY